MPLKIIQGDITHLKVDAIVDAANTQLLEGTGVCGAIFEKAGRTKLKAACESFAPIRTGTAIITPGFNLFAKHIIHAAGPIYTDHTPEDNERYLVSTYTSALDLATHHNLNSIAFPLISSGVYGYPLQEALKVALRTINEYLTHSDLDITLVIYDKESFKIEDALLKDIKQYLENNLEDDMMMLSETKVQESPRMLTDFHLDEPFSTRLLRLIDKKEKTDSEVYKKANIDRRLFSKIRSNKDYSPSKQTALALCIGLELTLDETNDLLNTAGYTLSKSKVQDVIIEYFINQNNYNIHEINALLFEYDQKLLGA